MKLPPNLNVPRQEPSLRKHWWQLEKKARGQIHAQTQN